MHAHTHQHSISDVILLAEALLCFRKEIYEHFHLDLFQYISIPQLAMDCFLSYTKSEIELMTDLDMFLDVEGSIRGGVSFVRQRLCKRTEDEQILYIDA